MVSAHKDSVAYVRNEASKSIAVIETWKARLSDQKDVHVHESLKAARDSQLPSRNLRVPKSDSDPNYEFRPKGVAWCQTTSNNRLIDSVSPEILEFAEGDEAFPQFDSQNECEPTDTFGCDQSALCFGKEESDSSRCTLHESGDQVNITSDVEQVCGLGVNTLTQRWNVQEIALMEAYGKEDLEVAFRLVLLEENNITLKRLLYHLTQVVHPLSLVISSITPTTGNALCAALLEILSTTITKKDYWLIFFYLVEFSANRKAFRYLYDRILCGVRKRLWRISMGSSKEAFEAIKVLFLWEKAMAFLKKESCTSLMVNRNEDISTLTLS